MRNFLGRNFLKKVSPPSSKTFAAFFTAPSTGIAFIVVPFFMLCVLAKALMRYRFCLISRFRTLTVTLLPQAFGSHHRQTLHKVSLRWIVMGNFCKSSPHPSKLLPPFIVHPHQKPFSYRFLFLCSALGKSRNAAQTLLDFFLSRADGALAPASVLVPPPKTLT